MPVDGVLTELEPGGRLLVAQALRHQPKNLELARREPAEPGGWADRLEINLLKKGLRGARMACGSEPLERGSCGTERDGSRIATAECEECMGELEPSAGRLERRPVPLEES